MWRNQHGDTLIEVIIATIIIGTVLFSAYSLSTRAYQLNQSARERTQAAQLLQQQAEGLISLRDTAANWSAFLAKMNAKAPDGSDAHFYKNGSSWDVANNSPAEYWQPGCGSSCGPGQDPNIASYYQLKSSIEYENNPNNLTEVDKIKATITIQWDPAGPSPKETSQLVVKVTNRQLPKISFEPLGTVG